MPVNTLRRFLAVKVINNLDSLPLGRMRAKCWTVCEVESKVFYEK